MIKDPIMMDDEHEDDIPLAVPLEMGAQCLDEGSKVAAMDTDMTKTNSIQDDTAPNACKQVPVLLLTGYLGSGKTTLVNYILTEKHGYRCAVLLNEIADTADVEKALVRDLEGGSHPAPLADWVQLENGCICCSVKSDMVRALEAMLEQRDDFDYIIIECTGLANPGPVAEALWTDVELESGVCLDAIVTVVDAKNIMRHLHEERTHGTVNEAQQQVAYADVILLNKIDLVSEATLQELEEEIASINSEVAIIPCERCVVDLARILDTGLYAGNGISSNRNVLDLGSTAEKCSSEAICQGHKGESSDSHGSHSHPCSAAPCKHCTDHKHDVHSITLYSSTPLCLKKVRYWLDEILWGREMGEEEGGLRVDSRENSPANSALHSKDIFRIKGLLNIDGSSNQWILQGVHELYDIVEGRLWPEGEQPSQSKIVFIGRNLDEENLRKGFESCTKTQ